MGMSSSDDDAKILEDQALLDWARQAPQSPSYDSNLSEEEKIAHEERIKEHMRNKPKTRNSWDTEKR